MRRCSSSVEYQLPKLRRRVRFPSSAYKDVDKFGIFLICNMSGIMVQNGASRFLSVEEGKDS